MSGDEVQAVGALTFPAEDRFDVSAFTVKPVERAVFRLVRRKSELVFNDSRLEGAPFTEPEVATLIEGRTVDGSDDFEVDRVLAISEATDRLIQLVQDREFAMSKAVSDTLHAIVGEFEALDAGMFRGAGSVSPGGGAVDVMGERFRGPFPGDRGTNLERIYDKGMVQVRAYSHPAVQATAYAAFATYNQFYFEANKRTARLMMNGHLMSAGLDAIVTPERRRVDYNRALRSLFLDADMSAYMAFLLSCYDG